MGLFDMFKAELHVSIHEPTVPVHAGGVLRGNVTLKVTKPLTYRSLRLELEGKETASAYVSRGMHTYASTGIAHEAEHLVLHELVTLAGHTKHSHEEGKLEAEAGLYVYPFEIQLPEHLPPTHCGYPRKMWGSSVEVKYVARVCLDIPMSINATAVAPFLVQVPTPASQLIAMPAPVGGHDWELKCKEDKVAGHLRAKAELDRGYMVANPANDEQGAPLKLTVDVDNTRGTHPVTAVLVGLAIDAKAHIDGQSTHEMLEKTHLDVPCEVAPGEQKVVECEVKNPRDLCCSYPGISATLDYVVAVGFKIPHLHCPTFTLPLVVVQTIDPANVVKETSWAHPSPFKTVTPGLEYAWSAPSKPTVAPAPLAAGVREADVPPLPWRPHEGETEAPHQPEAAPQAQH